MADVVIVIPTYKVELSNNEKISLDRCRKILGGYKRVFLAPSGIQLSYVEDEDILYVDPVHLSSRKKYSEYVLSQAFYKAFQQFDYMLVYQLDAFVFEDKLSEFMRLGYDYIGAPWTHGMECHSGGKQLWYIGNGGFSLRKVRAFSDWLELCADEVEEYKMILPEDLVISIIGKDHLCLAQKEDAFRFAYELNPEECFEQHNHKLPMGCHAWHRFEPEFWKRIIDSYGYDVQILQHEDKEAVLLNTGKQRNEKRNLYFKPEQIHNYLKELISRYDGDIYVFGAGVYGFSFANMINSNEIHILGFLDNDKSKWHKKILGYEIYSPNILNKDDAVLIALENPDKIMEQLNKMGLENGKNYATSHDLQMRMMKNQREES